MDKGILKKVLLLILATIILLCVAAASAEQSGVLETGITWALDDNGLLTISGTGTIPDYKAASSGQAPWLTYREQISRVRISEGITGIGNYAFYQCPGLIAAELPDSCTRIGEDVFYRSPRLREFNLPAKLESVGTNAFCQTECVRDLAFPSSLRSIGSRAFALCPELVSVSFAGQMDEIGKHAFSECTKLEQVCFRDRVGAIAYGAFSKCPSLQILVFAGDVENIDADGILSKDAKPALLICPEGSNVSRWAEEKGIEAVYTGLDFSGTPVENLHIHCAGKLGPIHWICTEEAEAFLFGEGATPDLHIGNYKWAGDYRKNILKIHVAAGVTGIGSFTFYDMWQAVEVDLPDTLESIGGYALGGLRSLQVLQLPEHLKFFGDYTLSGCEKLHILSIPSGMPFDYRYFYELAGLQQIRIEEGHEQYRSIDGALYDREGKTLLLYPTGREDPAFVLADTAEAIDKDAFQPNRFLREISMTKAVKDIPDGVFERLTRFGICQCPDGSFAEEWTLRSGYVLRKENGETVPANTVLAELEYTDNYRDNGEWTVKGCKNSDANVVIIPGYASGNTVVEVGEDAFLQNGQIRHVRLPSTIRTVNRNAFRECTALETVAGHQAETYLTAAFYGCSALKELFNGEELHGLFGMSAFAYCNALTQIRISGEFQDGVFQRCEALEEADVHVEQDAGRTLFRECPKLRTATVTGHVKEQSDPIASYCEALESVHMPSVDNLYKQQWEYTKIIDHCPSLQRVYVASFDSAEADYDYYPKNVTIYDDQGNILARPGQPEIMQTAAPSEEPVSAEKSETEEETAQEPAPEGSFEPEENPEQEEPEPEEEPAEAPVEPEAGEEEEQRGSGTSVIPGEAEKRSVNVKSANASSYITGKKEAYPPENMTDGREETAWQFSTKTTKLKKAYAFFEFDQPATVDELWIKNGFWRITKGYDQYVRNSRVKEMEISFRYQGSDEYTDGQKIKLKDDKKRKDWQKISLGRHEDVTGIQFRIISIYKGTKFPKDVCISEVLFVGQ